MCIKAVDNYPYALEFLPKCYKTENMCDKAHATYSSTIKFVLRCCMTQERCDKAVNRCFLYLILFLINIKLKKYVTVLFVKIIFQ